jgi:sulfur-carrier protein
VIRVVLPPNLRALARVEGEIEVDAQAATAGGVIDAIEKRFPMLRGTIRDHATGRRRSYVRFFACERDISHDALDAPLPADVENGREPLLIVGAISGG